LVRQRSVRAAGEALVLCVSEKSLLPVLVPARGGPAMVVDRLRAALAEILPALGIGAEAVEAELSAMDEFRLLMTASRAVLGSMNDFVASFEHMAPYRPGWSLRDWSIHLSDTPCGPLQMRFPAEVAKELLSVPM
jgi:hypothetical protein